MSCRQQPEESINGSRTVHSRIERIPEGPRQPTSRTEALATKRRHGASTPEQTSQGAKHAANPHSGTHARARSSRSGEPICQTPKHVGLAATHAPDANVGSERASVSGDWLVEVRW